MEAANWALVGVTVVLVILTGCYVYLTHLMLRRHDEQIESMTRPVLIFQLILPQANAVKLRIQNVGNGPALQVAGEIRTTTNKDGQVSVRWAYPVLTPGKYEEFLIPLPTDGNLEPTVRLDKIRGLVKEIGSEFKYRSSRGKTYDLSDAIAVSEVTDTWVNSRMQVTRNHPERIMPRIADSLENIARSLDKMDSSLESIRNDDRN